MNMFQRNASAVNNPKNKLMPASLSIEPTYLCNLNCSMCFYDKKNSQGKKELPIKDFIDFLEGREGVDSVIIPSREPMVKKGFFDLIAYLNKREIPYVLLTNGLEINENNYEKLLNCHTQSKIYLSIDGDEKIHSKIRGSDAAFERVVTAAKLLVGKIKLCIVCTISEDNLDYLWQLPRIIKEIGQDSVIFEYERRYTKKSIDESRKIMGAKGFELLKKIGKAKPRYSFDELKININKMEKIAACEKVAISYFPQYFKEKMAEIYNRRLRKNYRLSCKYFNDIRIDPEGNVIHCFAYRRPFGNIKKSSLEEIWNSRPYREFRKKLAANNLMPICETCWGATPLTDK